MGRPLKIKTPEETEQKWEDYKNDCTTRKFLTHDFSIIINEMPLELGL